MSRDPTYYVAPHDWPVGPDVKDLTMKEIHTVLNEFDQYYGKAVEGLAKTDVPRFGGQGQPKDSQ